MESHSELAKLLTEKELRDALLLIFANKQVRDLMTVLIRNSEWRDIHTKCMCLIYMCIEKYFNNQLLMTFLLYLIKVFFLKCSTNFLDVDDFFYEYVCPVCTFSLL